MVNQNGNRNIRDQVQGNVMVIGIRAMAIEEKRKLSQGSEVESAWTWNPVTDPSLSDFRGFPVLQLTFISKMQNKDVLVSCGCYNSLPQA